MKQNKFGCAILAVGILASTWVSAHGYVSAGPSFLAGRAALCKLADQQGHKNLNCGAVQWEPQSVEGPQGFPQAGPPDGQLAAAGLMQFAALNEQTPDRWLKQPITAGSQQFQWTFTANHVTRSWQYYITQPQWQPHQPLTRQSFDLDPFCVIDGHMAKPAQTVTHSCEVPEREGYQVILAVWDVGDTPAAFYNVIDVQFQGGSAEDSTWQQVGSIHPAMQLHPGDTVFSRVFNASAEVPSLSDKLTIATAAQGQPNQWAYLLASQINQSSHGLKAGQMDAQGHVVATHGRNLIYAPQHSSIRRVEIGYNMTTPPPSQEVTISGLADSYVLQEMPKEFALQAMAHGEVHAVIDIYNHAHESLAHQQLNLKSDEQKQFAMRLSKYQAGHHMLVIRLQDAQGTFIRQTSLDFMIVDASLSQYDFIFPEALKQYQAGTRVLASDKLIYQCKPFPYSGYCQQWSSDARQYEPGVGSDWREAWQQLH